jgi:hypothetical protein
MSDRKLYKVEVRPKWWMHKSEDATEHFYIEAENHEQAAQEGASRFRSSKYLYVEATHVPFSKIETQDGGRVMTDFKGDGSQPFEAFKDTHDVIWKHIGINAMPAAIAFALGFLVAMLIWT